MSTARMAGPIVAATEREPGRPVARVAPFSLFDKEEEVLRQAEAMLTQLQGVAEGVGDLADAYRQSYREQERLVRLSDRMQADLHRAKARLAEQTRDLKALNETLAAEIRHRTRLEAELRLLLETDSLTGARSRARLFELARRELLRRQRRPAPMSLLMLDLDHFKALNDAHGHEAGDIALRAFVTACMGQIRPTDVLGRLGGEEFALLLPETSLDEAMPVAERLCATVAALLVPAGEHGVLSISVSIGLAEIAEGETLEAALRRADRALYQAKQQGRARIIVAEPA